MRLGLAFLLRYALAASGLFAVWTWVGPVYVDAVAPVVNALASLWGLPMALEREGGHLLFRYIAGGHSFRLEALGQESITLNLVAGLALLAATPGRRPGWYLGWGSVVCALLWVTHVVSFTIGGLYGLWDYAGSGPAAVAMVHPLATAIPRDQAVMWQSLLDLWNVWGRYTVCLVLWMAAALRPAAAPRTAELRFPLPREVRTAAG